MGAIMSTQGLIEEYYRNRKVLVTGHTGFKGSWLTMWLQELGANIAGFALDPLTAKDNFVVCNIGKEIRDVRGDIRDMDALNRVFEEFQPEIVFHLAAQAIVTEGYANPKSTFDTNIGGTVNVLECCRRSGSVTAIINITSDKCYENREWVWGYRECDPMGGYDPYSASKGCSELVSAAYRKSFFSQQSVVKNAKVLATVRAGNVIGGGDWAADRIIPDCIRALEAGLPIQVRNPGAIRPWQHVLEPLSGYLLLGAVIDKHGRRFEGSWNFGPERASTIAVGELVRLAVEAWGSGSWESPSASAQVHEANVLTLDINKARYELGWAPLLTVSQAVQKTVEWYRHEKEGGDIRETVVRQIKEFMDYRI
jgi:CDP-glucose 4,6-dehydratase